MIPGAKSWPHGEGSLLAILAVFLCILLISVPHDAIVSAAPSAGPAVAPVQLAPLADAFIAEGLPDRNFGTDGKLWVGYDASGGYLQEQALLAFSSAEVTAPVSRVVLKLWLAGAVTAGAELQVMVYPVTGTWDQATVTWNKRPTSEAKPVSLTRVGTRLDWYEWDVTSAWQQNAATSPFSLLLSGPGNVEQNERAFWSKECASADCITRKPVLEIELATPTPTQTPSPTATRTPTPTPTKTPETCWAAWQSSSMIWLPVGSFKLVGFDYGSCRQEGAVALDAKLSGAAVFDQRAAAQETSVPLGTNGPDSFKVYPAAGATPGARFWLAAELAGTALPTREGVVGGPLYLPLIVRNSQLLVSTSTPTPSPSATSTPTATVGATDTPSSTPSATATRTPSTTPSRTPTDEPTSTPSITPTSTPSGTRTSTPSSTPTRTPTYTPTPTWTPIHSETVRGSVKQSPANVPMNNVEMELYQHNSSGCTNKKSLSTSTNYSGLYAFTTSGPIPYSVCIQPKKTPEGCSGKEGESYRKIVTFDERNQEINGIDFVYNCP